MYIFLIEDNFFSALPSGYLLSNAGYDVWFGNARGNRYNVNHKTLNTNSKEFWSFSWHEIGYYDLPAMIDLILKETYQEKLQYIGYSQVCV
jgi:lysosomal acid lipase/cholesteryl ester hydrolase